jgi:hypothetical protein
MSKNRGVRIALAQVYGSGCMFKKSGAERYIEKLGKIKTYKQFKEERRYSSKKLKALENLLTLHHLKHKSERRKGYNRKWGNNKRSCSPIHALSS